MQILLALILLGVNTPALAVDRTFQVEIENSLKETVPANWWLRASWRDQTLVVFVSPHVNDKVKLSEEEIQNLLPMRRPIAICPD